MKTFCKYVATCALVCAAQMAGIGHAQNQSAPDAIYRELGGNEGIAKIIAVFLPIVLADGRIKDTFTDVDIARLGKSLTEQFCALSGGPCQYRGKDMATIHADLAITNAQFNALTEDLQIAMDKSGISYRTQNKLVALLAPMQRSIVTK